MDIYAVACHEEGIILTTVFYSDSKTCRQDILGIKIMQTISSKNPSDF